MSGPSSLLARQALDLDGPSIPVPAGQTSELDNPPNGNHIAIPFISVAVVVSAILFLLRFYAKFLTKKLNLPDCMPFILPIAGLIPTDLRADLTFLAFVRRAGGLALVACGTPANSTFV